MEEKFTVKEFGNYVRTQGSLDDVLYNLNAENIRKTNPQESGERFIDECRFYDYAQGRGNCICIESPFGQCKSICECFEAKRIKK